MKDNRDSSDYNATFHIEDDIDRLEKDLKSVTYSDRR